MILVLSLSDGAQVNSTTFGVANSGAITITASDAISLSGESSRGLLSKISSEVDGRAFAKGNSRGIIIDTGSLSLTNGAQVNASTSGLGNAGAVEINASDSITVDGSRIVSEVETRGTGDAGAVIITTGSLNLTNGGRVIADTFGQGNAGSVEITARDTISIDGEDLGGTPSGVTSQVNPEAEGDAGGIIINTGSLFLINGGTVSARTSGQGNAGNVLVKSNSLELIGTSIIDEDPSAIFASSDNFSPAGNLTIETRELTIADGASVSVSSPSGLAGNLNINANSLSQNRGEIVAETGLSEGDTGANINVEISELWSMENESLVSASALGDADGGNININTDPNLSNIDLLLVAFPPIGDKGSDIIANAVNGDGGRIEINAAGVFGIEFRDAQTPLNDFTVSSGFGTSGEIIINRIVDDPTSGLVELPQAVRDPSDQISQNPCEQGVGSEFIITGKGGFPANPNETLKGDGLRVGLVEPIPSGQPLANGIRPSKITSEIPTPEAVPAMGWIFNDKGEVTLTVYPTTETEIQRSSQQISNACSDSSFLGEGD